jgi:hypothetical protein
MALDIENTLRDKMSCLTSAEFEGLVCDKHHPSILIHHPSCRMLMIIIIVASGI